jgi:hypothetical protein
MGRGEFRLQVNRLFEFGARLFKVATLKVRFPNVLCASDEPGLRHSRTLPT